MADLWLAIAHHVLVFGLVIMLSVQASLVREGMGRSDAARVARLDIGYGASAGLIVAVGLLRGDLWREGIFVLFRKCLVLGQDGELRCHRASVGLADHPFAQMAKSNEER
jgi:hypothetical protein